MSTQINLPQLSDALDGIVKLPPAPSNPPTPTDFVNARQLKEDVWTTFKNEQIASAQDVLRTEKYCADIFYAADNEAVVPPWFQPAVEQALAPIRQNLQRCSRIAAITYNLTLGGDGLLRRFQVVPFADGSDPREGLPQLLTSRAVEELQGPQATEYFRGYYPDVQVPQSVPERKKQIRLAIGCRLP
ncbi:hypothetical protein BOTBODRAFT_494665 [Botryobasidium botryosum FD-172 SS1]|uniref:Mug135-like C-terminal domain-containing protein n=1 Tax=Botryobasidium botryosum (strain FD-172 SS1) TaxID=930990 RepID=A0A067M6Q6_BOTB1|nr:hypothetical protein BOTBODRAFT_494665 [Botryobasidium botryosum FD-172 SS1]